jgi:chorismate mutase
LEKIQSLRKRIDEIDEQILRLLNERVESCKAIGLIKKEHGIPIRDPSREKEIYKHIREKAAKLGLNLIQAEAIFREIIAMGIYVQESKEKTS